MTVLGDDRGFGPCATKGGAGSENGLKIFVGLLVTKNALGNLKQAAKVNQSRDAPRCPELSRRWTGK